MSARPRIDLDGVTLTDEDNPKMVIAVMRWRTKQGLVLLMPESGDFLVDWTDVASTSLDLQTGRVRIELVDDFVASQNWLRGAKVLVGDWIDRLQLDAAALPMPQT